MKIEKKILVGITALMFFGMVSAGSISNLQYKDRNLWWDKTRTVNDDTVDIEADYLNGYSVEDMYTEWSAEWSGTNLELSGGMSSRALSSWLTGKPTVFEVYGTFMNYLSRIFATNDRLDRVEALVYLGKDATEFDITMTAALIKANREGRKVKVGEYTCDPVLDRCMKFESG